MSKFTAGSKVVAKVSTAGDGIRKGQRYEVVEASPTGAGSTVFKLRDSQGQLLVLGVFGDGSAQLRVR